MKQKLREKLLIYKIKTSKDSDAFGELYDLYINKIFRFIFFKVSNKEEAEDITSEVFLKAWNYLINQKQNKDVRSFSGFIYSVARSNLVDFYRKKGRLHESSIEDAENLLAAESGNFEEIKSGHDMDMVLDALKKIKQNYQEVIILKYMEEMSIAEIAGILKKSRTVVRVTLHRALKVLKRVLLEEK